MIEAMACGTPVIAFRRGSAPEIIDEGVSGFLVDDVLQATAAARRVAELDRRLAARCCGARGNIPAGAPSPCGRDVVKPPGIAFQKFSKLDRHRPRIRVNHAPTLQVTDQIAMKIIQAVIKDDRNPRPFSIVAKNFSTSHGRNNFASFLIDDEIISHAYLQQRLGTPRLTGDRRGGLTSAHFAGGLSRAPSRSKLCAAILVPCGLLARPRHKKPRGVVGSRGEASALRFGAN